MSYIRVNCLWNHSFHSHGLKEAFWQRIVFKKSITIYPTYINNKLVSSSMSSWVSSGVSSGVSSSVSSGVSSLLFSWVSYGVSSQCFPRCPPWCLPGFPRGCPPGYPPWCPLGVTLSCLRGDLHLMPSTFLSFYELILFSWHCHFYSVCGVHHWRVSSLYCSGLRIIKRPL